MEDFNRKSHWENVYQTKQLTEASWYQARPDISLDFLHKYELPKSARIIDVGGGDSLLVDHLLAEGFENVTVLDISEKALERAKARLGEKASLVKWVVCDAAAFKPKEKYDFWHDRAAFHFFTKEKDIKHYIKTVQQSIAPGGYLVLGTFSENGPEKCSGLPIKQYSESAMKERLQQFFEKLKCLTVKHLTPSEKVQEFVFCSFKRLNLG
ncbi:MAG: class I SAM-dependent methyltransferase [Saprospiraceae bacterium]|nr:class I SAM-dependent methyltransferase [Saprospiraceae bacterium]MCF8248431.1 class I SAM-dependent methyltransferase [Saprospiraceae bacterium]MCF8280102.1 class I SAM-dependent methyltransferase [Bacteroidales bacterium]MCF8309959.1 class I SAM-dependent methyltransferase [Saprospiraceae bacterium]MCF8438710.1 class I SAM-dependent methyltransferase [Saprospiraceae bacterium]